MHRNGFELAMQQCCMQVQQKCFPCLPGLNIYFVCKCENLWSKDIYRSLRQGPRNTGARVGYSPPPPPRPPLFSPNLGRNFRNQNDIASYKPRKSRKPTLTPQGSSVIVRWSELVMAHVKISQWLALDSVVQH